MTALPADSSISQTSALAYWSSIPPTIDGMLGGYPQVSRIDLRSSQTFITKLRRVSSTQSSTKPLTRAVDCGAGIGRITTGLLVNIAAIVDMVEPVREFTSQFEEQKGVEQLREQGRIGDVYNEGLESWKPPRKYSLIWNQWCLCQLSDRQLVEYIRRCLPMLDEGGWIVVKENQLREESEEDMFDGEDSSVTRTEAKWRACFEEAGAKIIANELQKGFPRELYPVRMWALQAKT